MNRKVLHELLDSYDRSLSPAGTGRDEKWNGIERRTYLPPHLWKPEGIQGSATTPSLPSGESNSKPVDSRPGDIDKAVGESERVKGPQPSAPSAVEEVKKKLGRVPSWVYEKFPDDLFLPENEALDLARRLDHANDLAKVRLDMFQEADDKEFAARKRAEELQRAYTLLEHKIITCGVAAEHPNANLSNTGAYIEKWDSPQAQAVRKLRQRAEGFEQRCRELELTLGNLVSLLLQTMEPIGPMRSRNDYPPELQTDCWAMGERIVELECKVRALGGNP